MKYFKCRKYKYQLSGEHKFKLHFDFPNINNFKWCSINNNELTIKDGYCWDGPSGTTIDTKNSLVPSLIHDCLYQLIRLKLLDFSFKEYADKEFYKLLRERKMFWLRAVVWYLSVRYFGKKSCTVIQSKEIELECD